MGEITEKDALKLWDDMFPGKEFAQDCFGTWMCRSCWSNEKCLRLRPGNTKKYDYSWNVDHIRPKSDFSNEDASYFFGNYEPMHRLNNEEKKDNYPSFKIDNNNYKVVKDGYGGYGIADSSGKRIDIKAKLGVYYK